jgi:large subunit ribosomal protein L6
MSRIGKKPIEIPEAVTVQVGDDNTVTVKGPKGQLSQSIDPDIRVRVEGASVLVERPTDQRRHRALHGLYRTLINNMVVGVSAGYTRQLELVGVGYKAVAQDNVLELSLGHSHNIFMQVPSEIKVNAVTEKGKNPTIKLEGIDKQLLGHITAKIQSLRKVEPYKGKGVRISGQHIRRKAGKTSAK